MRCRQHIMMVCTLKLDGLACVLPFYIPWGTLDTLHRRALNGFNFELFRSFWAPSLAMQQVSL